MRARMLDRTVSRFVATSYEKSNEDCYVDKLDILEAWEQFRADNASGHVVDAKTVIEKFSEIFPGCKMGEYRINGVSKRQPRPGKIRRQPSAEETEEYKWQQSMSFKFKRFIDSRSIDQRTEPFKVQHFAHDCQAYHMGAFLYPLCNECSLEDATKYLSSLEYLYYDESDGMWHFHKRDLESFK